MRSPGAISFIRVSGNVVELVVLLALVAGAFACSAGLIVLLRPVLLRYALARPNARSSHREPTPQGGGIAVIAAALLATAAGWLLASEASAESAGQWPWLLGATALLALVGALDDIRPLPAAPRLLAQAAAVAAVVTTLPANWDVLPFVPRWLEQALLLLAGLWFVNLTNFMDGLDWMTVAEVVPVTAVLALFGWTGLLPWTQALAAAGLLGAVLGFAPFNRPVAKLFLGDVGSLPIGLLLGWLLTALAGAGHLVAALLLPLYYLADATITLLRRAWRRERVWEAHRSHFYQRATMKGWAVPQIVARVFCVNVALAALAGLTVTSGSRAVDAACGIAGAVLVGWLLRGFTRPPRGKVAPSG